MKQLMIIIGLLIVPGGTPILMILLVSRVSVGQKIITKIELSYSIDIEKHIKKYAW